MVYGMNSWLMGSQIGTSTLDIPSSLCVLVRRVGLLRWLSRGGRRRRRGGVKTMCSVEKECTMEGVDGGRDEWRRGGPLQCKRAQQVSEERVSLCRRRWW